MNPTPRILFFGYGEVGWVCLEALLARGDCVVALITHEDDPRERIWFRRPAELARAHRVPVFAPASVDTSEWAARIAGLAPDLILSAYYRHLIPMRILQQARLGAFNLHGSLLPKFRGRAPVNWAIVQGARETGVTLHRMVARADAGPIVDQARCEIGPRDTAEQLFRKIVPLARDVLERQIDALLAGSATETPQVEAEATRFGGRTPEDGRIDWTRSTQEIFDLVRAVTRPFPGAFSDCGGSRLTVWWAEPVAAAETARHPAATPGAVLSAAPLVIATGDGALRITDGEWQPGAAAAVDPRHPPVPLLSFSSA